MGTKALFKGFVYKNKINKSKCAGKGRAGRGWRVASKGRQAGKGKQNFEKFIWLRVNQDLWLQTIQKKEGLKTEG